MSNKITIKMDRLPLFTVLVIIIASLIKFSLASAQDDLQREYLTKLSAINSEIKRLCPQLLQNEERGERLDELYFLDLRAHNFKTSANQRRLEQELKDDRERYKTKIEGLKNDKDNLKLDILKYYSGKMPDWLKEEWSKEERDFTHWISTKCTAANIRYRITW